MLVGLLSICTCFSSMSEEEWTDFMGVSSSWLSLDDSSWSYTGFFCSGSVIVGTSSLLTGLIGSSFMMGVSILLIFSWMTADSSLLSSISRTLSSESYSLTMALMLIEFCLIVAFTWLWSLWTIFLTLSLPLGLIPKAEMMSFTWTCLSSCKMALL